MTWQLAAFGLLAVALAAGFAWYERTRPDARIVALVGTLAAFAALGRMAFAAVPNVKPTTDIVLASGFALGGAPGFVVGATAALSSNFFFGQGPWTPWQMIGWGLVGVAGAGVALLSRGRIGRWPLAIVCFALGFAFTALQDFGDWVTYSDHSSAQLWVYLGKGIGFDLVHATGCLLFALAFGPALLRALRRFRARIEVRWRVPGDTIVPALLAATLVSAAVLFAPAQELPRALGRTPAQELPRALGRAPAVTSGRLAGPLNYLVGAQNRDGGFGASTGAPSSSLYTGWVALALAAAGRNGATMHAPGGATVLDYLASNLGARPDADTLERTLLAARALGADASSFGGRNLLAGLKLDIGHNGSVQGQTNLTAFAVLSLRASHAKPPSATTAWLLKQQDADGGFNFATAPGVSDVDDSAAVIEALRGSNRSPRRGHVIARAIQRAVAFIRAQQNHDGGFPSQPGGLSNAQSTAFAVQGLLAAGVDPSRVHRHGSRTPIAYLQSLIAANGHVRYQAGVDTTPVWVTAQAVLALAGRPLPVSPPRPHP